MRLAGEDDRYFTKQDPQYLTIKNMIKRLAQEPDSRFNYYDHDYVIGTAYEEGAMSEAPPGITTECREWTDCDGVLNGDCFLLGVPGLDEINQAKLDAAVDCESDFMDWDDGKLFIMGEHVVFFESALKMVAAATSVVGAAINMF